MSEIFEALRKAQRDADQQREPRPAAEAAGNAVPRPAEASPAVETPRPVVASPTREPVPPRAARTRPGWLPKWLGGHSQNGTRPSDSPILVSAKLGTAISEQFRVLRARVETVGFGTFMVTSAMDKEGKTLCASNLAVVLSLSLGAGVILIDSDLRNPSVSKWLRLRSGKGLVECLLGETHWKDCLQDTEHERLRVLPAGRSSSMSTELLASERMFTLLGEIKDTYPAHYIVVDAPPLLLTADPLVLARHVDHVLLVVRADITPRSAVMKAIDILGTERFMGIVLNGATANVSEYYYYGRYPYGDPPKS